MAISIGMTPSHPGGFLKRSVLPEALSITEAAQVLGVGRPALSTFLNEKSSLSPEMAMRIEKAFGVKSETLLRMQARYDAFKARQDYQKLDVKPYQTNPSN